MDNFIWLCREVVTDISPVILDCEFESHWWQRCGSYPNFLRTDFLGGLTLWSCISSNQGDKIRYLAKTMYCISSVMHLAGCILAGTGYNLADLVSKCTGHLTGNGIIQSQSHELISYKRTLIITMLILL